MSTVIGLPRPDGSTEVRRLQRPVDWSRPTQPIRCRVALAAAHVVADPLGGNAPGAPAALDWDETLGFRRHLWSWGLGVAEAMDTAQRGMGLDWAATAELIERSAAEAAAVGGRIAAGAGTDHAPARLERLSEVVAAYELQLEAVEASGAQPVLMASRQLALLARSADDYLEVYGKLLAQVAEPVILHWLGPAFDPALEGYWGSEDLEAASGTVRELVAAHASAIDGVKVSLLDADREVALREALPQGVRLYTGDDFSYPGLIAGGSDALLGIFAAIAPAASVALQRLDGDDEAGFEAALAPTVPLARHLFSTPTPHYKAGVAFMSWLQGHQRGFTMVGGMHSARSVGHLLEVFRLADAARLLPDPELAAARMRSFLAVAGLGE